MQDNECQPVEIDKYKDIFLGQVVHSKDEAYNLYQEHGFKMGFSVRKGKELYYDNDKKNTRLKDFYCSKQGFKNNEPEGEIASKVAYQRVDSRTNCKAMVRFNVSKDGEWRITKFIMDHNHEFVPLEQRHLLRSFRKVSEAKGGLIKSMVNAGMKVTNIWNYLGEEVGGYDKLGMTMKDMHNFVYTEKMKLIEAGDAQSLVNHLQNRQAQDAMFYYSVQLDQESRLTNVFWRDGKSRVDYDCFGDVVVFDTTYRTNKYNLICAPFVGVNHHGQNVMFGCAFLSNETSISFNWLFKVFLESMGNKQPKTIFTDQDEAMAKAIGELNLNLKGTTSDNNFTQNEDTEHAAICNPLPAQTKGISYTRKKGQFEKWKGSTTKEKQPKKKKKKDNFCSINSSMDGPSNVHSNIDNTLNVPFTSFGAPPIPFTSMLQGTNSLVQESSNHRFPPSSPISGFLDFPPISDFSIFPNSYSSTNQKSNRIGMKRFTIEPVRNPKIQFDS
ncbi:unnamed protein product [Trifolium pratense]|uniref:Uncharacterized protein n=1 Tax=Trifolium pratense TaxID=57577 RepID=A0ACB0J796_TRIPR|nr:unnamed protein product [Trifolium pratense]